MTNGKVCTCCGIEHELVDFRFKREKKRPAGFYLSICKACEKKKYREYQQTHREYFQEYGRKFYLKKIGQLTRQSPLDSDPEITKEKKRVTTAEWRKQNPEKVRTSRLRQKLNGNDVAKASRRRAAKKNACVVWDQEFTDFVVKEAGHLCKIRVLE